MQFYAFSIILEPTTVEGTMRAMRMVLITVEVETILVILVAQRISMKKYRQIWRRYFISTWIISIEGVQHSSNPVEGGVLTLFIRRTAE